MTDFRRRETLGGVSTLTSSLHEPAPTHQPPSTLLAEHGNLQFHVERLLKRRRHKGQHQYLVKWRGYPESENSWEFEVPLWQDCPFAVDVFKHRAEGQLASQRAFHQ